MKRFLVMAALMALTAVPADAGEGCSGDTQGCLDYMTNQLKESGWVGVEMDGSESDGMVITKVVEGSPAQEAGLHVNDVLMAINGIEMNGENHEQLKAARAEWTPGMSVTWSMSRDANDREVEITLAPMPADVLARYIGQHMIEHATTEVASN